MGLMSPKPRAAVLCVPLLPVSFRPFLSTCGHLRFPAPYVTREVNMTISCIISSLRTPLTNTGGECIACWAAFPVKSLEPLPPAGCERLFGFYVVTFLHHCILLNTSSRSLLPSCPLFHGVLARQAIGIGRRPVCSVSSPVL